MGHSSVASPTDASGLQPAPEAQASSHPQQAQQPLWATVAQTGGVWLARQVHEQTAWAEEPSKAEDRPAAQESPRARAAPAPIQAAEAADTIGQLIQSAQAVQIGHTAQAGNEASPRRLKIVFEPDIRAAAASYAR